MPWAPIRGSYSSSSFTAWGFPRNSLVPLILAGLSLFFVGIIIERGLLRFVL